MKHMKRIVSIVLALTMVLAMGISAFAAETITITPNDQEDHTYGAVEILTFDVEEDENGDNVLMNVKYGSVFGNKAGSLVENEKLEALKAVMNGTDAEKLAVIKDQLGLTDQMLEAASTVATAESKGGNAAEISVPATGYYMIKDTAAVTGAGAKTAWIFMAVDGADDAKTSKSDVPSTDKEVEDSGEEDHAGYNETADHKVGDEFKFKLKGEIPESDNIALYKDYAIRLEDTMSDGLDFKKIESVKVIVDGGETKTLTDEYTTDATDNMDAKSFFVQIDSIKGIVGEGVLGVKKITVEVEFKAALNEQAKSVGDGEGTDCEKNEVKMKFSNNPNYNGSGDPEWGETPEDYVFVFTYHFDTTKNFQGLDEGEELPEGEAALFHVEDAAGNTIKLTLIKTEENGDFVYCVDEEGTVEQIRITKNGQSFRIKGLDTGDYKVVEDQAPNGFTPLEDKIDVKIEATHTEENGGASASASATITDDGNIRVDNKQGTVLPETGGIGTTIFYVVGAMLAIGAAVVLVTKKRVNG